MKLVADENVDHAIVAALRRAGYDVIDVAETTPGASDPEVLAAASAADAVLVTCDKDFGELVFRQRLLASGVLLIRLAGLSTDLKARLVVEALRAHGEQFAGGFSVIEPGWVRVRRHAAS